MLWKSILRLARQVENVNLELVKHFASEQKALGHPPATLFAFCISLVAYNVLSVVQASLRSAHGEAASPENLSSYYVAHSLASGWEATMLIDDTFWVKHYSGLNAAELAVELKAIAQHLDISKYRKTSTAGPLQAASCPGAASLGWRPAPRR